MARRHQEITGAAAVAKHLPFSLLAPSKLVGLPRRSVTLLDWGGKPAALASYGQNLGGIAVIEQPADSTTSATQSRAAAETGTGSIFRPCRSTARPGRSSTPRSARWFASPAPASPIRSSARYRQLPPMPPRGRCDSSMNPDAIAPPPPIEVRGLVKRYGELTAVAGVDLTVNVGDVYGYLGPNGAGKTTSLRMMLGLIRPTAGSVALFGRDPMLGVHALDGVAGFVEAPTFYPYLTGRRNLELLAAFDGGDARSRIDRGARHGRARRPGEGSRRRLLARHAPAAWNRGGVAARSQAAAPRRARHRARSRPACATCGC